MAKRRPQVHAVLDNMADFSNRVRSGAWKGYTGKRIRNVINVGIGGSDLGPVMAYEALKHYSDRAMTFRFVSNVDSTDFAEAVWDLDPGETVFHYLFKDFYHPRNNDECAHCPRLVSLQVSEAMKRRWRGILLRCRPMLRKWRGSALTLPTCSGSGTGSADAWMNSAIGLSTMIAIGPDNFHAMFEWLPPDGQALPYNPF